MAQILEFKKPVKSTDTVDTTNWFRPTFIPTSGEDSPWEGKHSIDEAHEPWSPK